MKAIIGEMTTYESKEKLAYTDRTAADVLVKYKTYTALIKNKQNLQAEISLLSGLLSDMADEQLLLGGVS